MRWIIVGLGNPGKEYEKHRHNIGFYALERLRQAWNFPDFRTKGDLRIAQGTLANASIILCCPQSYMNLSGSALLPLIAQYKKDRWLVVHDELDLPCGVIRWKKDGGTGGHNGLKSIHHVFGPDYERCRIGIDRPRARESVSSYVLSPFSSEQRQNIEEAIEDFLTLLPLKIQGEDERFVQALHALRPQEVH